MWNVAIELNAGAGRFAVQVREVEAAAVEGYGLVSTNGKPLTLKVESIENFEFS